MITNAYRRVNIGSLDMIIKIVVSTNRKWNVLSKLISPKVMLSIRYITSELEEMEREDNFRLKRFKELKLKRNHDSDDSNARCYCDKKPGKGDDFTCAVCKKEEDKRKDSRNASYDIKSKTFESEVIGDKPSRLTTANQKRLNDLTTHLEIVISLTNQCKTEGLMSSSADTFVYACKEVRCKLEEIDQPQNCCNTNDTQLSQDASGTQANQDCNKEEIEDITCIECDTQKQYSKTENATLLGCFETKYKEIVKVIKTQNEDGTISEEKQVITIKTERRHPHKSNELGGLPCCKIDSFDSGSGFDSNGGKNYKTSCKEVRTAQSKDIPSSMSEPQTKVRLCASDTKNLTKDSNKTVKVGCTVRDTGTEPKTPSVSSITVCPKKSSSVNENSKVKERDKDVSTENESTDANISKNSTEKVCCYEKCPSQTGSSKSKISEKSSKSVCCNIQCPSQNGSSKSKISETSIKSICCNKQCPSQTGSSKSKISEKSSKSVCCDKQYLSQSGSSETKISEKSSKNIRCNQECPSQTGSSKSKVSEKSSKSFRHVCPTNTSSKSKLTEKRSRNECCNKIRASQSESKSKTLKKSSNTTNQKSHSCICCNRESFSKSEISKSKASEKSSKKSIKNSKIKTLQKDESCSCTVPTKPACCDAIWKDHSSSTTDLAESSEETEEKCICIQETDTAEPNNESLCCNKEDDKVKKKKSSFILNLKICGKSKDKLEETVKCPQCNTQTKIVPESEKCPNCFTKSENENKLQQSFEKCPSCAAKTDNQPEQCPQCAAISNVNQSPEKCPECDAQVELKECCEKCPNSAVKSAKNKDAKLKSDKCPHCGVKVEPTPDSAKCSHCAARSKNGNSKESSEKCPHCAAKHKEKLSSGKCSHCTATSGNDETIEKTGKCPHCAAKTDEKPSSGKCSHCTAINETKSPIVAAKSEIKPSSGKCAYCSATSKIDNDMTKENVGKCPHCVVKSEVKQISRKCSYCIENEKQGNDNDEAKSSSGKCPQCVAKNETKPSSGKCSHCASKSAVKLSSGKCPQCTSKSKHDNNKAKPTSGKCSHCTSKSDVKSSSEKCTHCNSRNSLDVNERNTSSGKCPHCSTESKAKPSSQKCPHCTTKVEVKTSNERWPNSASKGEIKQTTGDCPLCNRNNETKNKEAHQEPYCKIRIISKQKDETDNRETVQEFIFPGNILDAIKKILEPSQSQEDNNNLTNIEGSGGSRKSCSCSTLPKSPPLKSQSCPLCGQNNEMSTTQSRQRSQSLGNMCYKQNNESSKSVHYGYEGGSNQNSLERGKDSCPSCGEKTKPHGAVCECLASSAINCVENKEEQEDNCTCRTGKGPKLKEPSSTCPVCEAKSNGYNQNDMETKCPKTILKKTQSCPVCDNQDQKFSNVKKNKSEESCCSMPKMKLCCDSDEVVSKVDASTSTRRSDRYDVRPLKLMKSQKKLTCTCQSDSILLQNTTSLDPKRCKSCMSYHNYYCM